MFWSKKNNFVSLIAGLGNPGRKYEETLHNAGFRVVQEVSRLCGDTRMKKRGSYLYTETSFSEKKIVLIQPLTYMNLSGNAVGDALRWYGLSAKSLTLVYDDMDLEPGVVRLRTRGGTGGHKGVASVIDVLGTDIFNRVRIGIGKPSQKSHTKSFVLAAAGEEAGLIAMAEKKAAEAVIFMVSEGIEATMNKFNSG